MAALLCGAAIFLLLLPQIIIHEKVESKRIKPSLSFRI